MKQTTIKLLCAGLMMTAAACSNDPETENVAPQGQRTQMSFTATSAETRTALVDKTKVHWQEGDEIQMYTQDKTGDLSTDGKFTTAESGPAVTFTGEATADAEKYFALYPSSAANGIFSDGSAKNILLKKQDIQTATAGSFDPAANISFAESADGKTLRFENLFGLVKFRRPTTSQREIVKATLHGNNGEKLTATSIQFPGKTLVSGEYDEEKVVLEGEIATGTDYYFVVRPVELTQGFYITFLDKDGAEYLVKGTKSASIKAGHILNLGELNLEAVEKNFEYNYETNTFTVYTETGLRNWAEAVRMESTYIDGEKVDMTKTNCILEADIELTKEWTPVGSGDNSKEKLVYMGTFDGQGHTISGLTITEAIYVSTDYGSYTGFFGMMRNAAVRNVTFDSPSVTNGSAGVITGYAENSTIENCHVRKATVIGKSEAKRGVHNAGGLVAHADDGVSILNCTVTGKITAQTITSSGNIKGQSGPVGGIVGRATGKTTISGCHFNGSLISEGTTKSNAGGIVGDIETGSGSIEGCTANVTVNSKHYTGGITGYVKTAVTIDGCASGGTLTCTKECGGLVGYYPANIHGSYSTCQSASEQTGGLFGYYVNSVYKVEACFTNNTEIGAIAVMSSEWTAEEANAVLRVDNIADKKDEMNGAIAATGWQFVENDGTIEVGSETFALDRTAFPLKPVKAN